MKSKANILGRFPISDLVIIAILSALGIATKPIIVPLVHIITGPLYIPGGAVAGGFYMMWIVLGAGFVKKFGTGTLIGFVQSILVIATGAIGTHGILSIISYTLPGIAADTVFLIARDKKYNVLHYVFGCIVANIVGTIISNILFFRLPTAAVLLVLSAAGLSGLIGGLIAYSLMKSLDTLNIGL